MSIYFITFVAKVIWFMKKLTQEEFIEKCKSIHKDKYDYSNVVYTGNRNKITIICKIHGAFIQQASAHSQGQNCPKCALENKVVSKNTWKPKIEERKKRILDKFANIHNDKYIYKIDGTERMEDYISIICKKHNYEYKQRLTNHLRGHGCPICCGTNKSFTTEEFIIKAKEVHGNIYTYDKVKYIDKETPITITCKVHGDFLQKPHNHINGGGCPFCKIWKTQQKIFEKLKENFPNETWIWEYTTDWLCGQRIDIFNPKLNLAIEYNGRQHYEPVEIFGGEVEFEKRKILDNKKKDLLAKHNCTLYIIKYNEYDEASFLNNIKTFIRNEN